MQRRCTCFYIVDEIRLPLGSIHFIEHLRHERGDRRKRLAEVYDRFSRGWHIASWSNVVSVEIRRTLAETFDGHLPMPKPEVFGKGFLHGLGWKERELLVQNLSESQLNLMQPIAALPGAVFDLLTFPNEAGRCVQKSKITELSRANASAAEELRAARKPHPKEMLRKAQYVDYTIQHQDTIISALDDLGLAPSDFLRLGAERLSQFWSSVPSLDVDCELTLYRDRQWSRPVDANDVRDIGHLVLAIPYCDFVVTERFWARAIQETGLILIESSFAGFLRRSWGCDLWFEILLAAIAAGAVIGAAVISALCGLAGIWWGTRLTTKSQERLAELDRRHRLTVAALEKRLEVHQQAYSLWRKIIHKLFKKEELHDVLIECQEFWDSNCLYLGEKAREEFGWCMHFAPVYEHEDVDTKLEKWDRFMGAATALADAVCLPPINEPDLPKEPKGPG